MLVKEVERSRVFHLQRQTGGGGTKQFQLGSRGFMEGKMEAQIRVGQLKKMPFSFLGELCM